MGWGREWVGAKTGWGGVGTGCGLGLGLGWGRGLGGLGPFRKASGKVTGCAEGKAAVGPLTPQLVLKKCSFLANPCLGETLPEKKKTEKATRNQ